MTGEHKTWQYTAQTVENRRIDVDKLKLICNLHVNIFFASFRNDSTAWRIYMLELAQVMKDNPRIKNTHDEYYYEQIK